MKLCICGKWAESGRSCDKCRAGKRAARQNQIMLHRRGLTARLIELGGPKFLNVLERGAIRTRAETGRIMGLSEESIRLIEIGALIKVMESFKQLETA